MDLDVTTSDPTEIMGSDDATTPPSSPPHPQSYLPTTISVTFWHLCYKRLTPPNVGPMAQRPSTPGFFTPRKLRKSHFSTSKWFDSL
ncbi:hypothetical protein PGT21_032716 [Puccinia graminis f. sp. tritici]|uniref:Uncharacterized protein n=1 Tax=Puccinia graminis f. sp. tritici TaxID=56615 RepID=A0A5B0M7Y3_PUCGR|nr:hypothetical protein PGT21_032716 [Puccinia graminis f. sp. tritici]